MSIKNKVLIIIGPISLILLIVIVAISNFLLTTSFQQVESDAVGNNVIRVQNAIQADGTNLSRIVADWSYWTDTYDFVRGDYTDYENDNLDLDTLANLDINMMLFFDKDGNLHLAKIADQGFLKYESMDPLLASAFENELAWLLRHEFNLSNHKGLATSSNGPIMLASRAILPNDQTGTPAGTLIMGRYYDESRIDQLSQSINLELGFWEWNAEEWEPGLPQPDEMLNETMRITPADAQVIYGDTFIQDINGNPIMLLRLEMERDIFQQGQNALQLLTISLILATVIIMYGVAVLLDRTVLNRIITLEESVSKITETRVLAFKNTDTSQDEIGSLQRGFSDLVTQLKDSRNELENQNERLEELVQERTIALDQSVQDLKSEVALRKQKEEDARIARDQALEALRLKTQILANVSHDARTPLSVISLRAEMLERERHGKLSEKQHKMIASIRQSVDELLHFLNNLLEQARSGNAEIVPDIQSINIREWLPQFTHSYELLSKRKSLELIVSVADNVPANINTDEKWLHQILGNLVSNAIKFTEKGSVKLSVHRKDQSALTITVQDTGIGIPAGETSQIFEPFWQVDGSITRQANRGIGLGLSIVKNFVTLLDGQISVESEEHVGTIFTIDLPINTPVKETA